MTFSLRKYNWWLSVLAAAVLTVLTGQSSFLAADHHSAKISPKSAVATQSAPPPMASVTGVVQHADGRPAAGAMVRIEGSGYSGNIHETATCGDDGTFQIPLPENKYYLLVAESGKFVSASHMQVIHSGKPVPRISLALRPACRIHGTLTVGSKRLPHQDEEVKLYLSDGDAYFKLPEEQQLPTPAKMRPGQGLYTSLTRSTKTNALGEYEFFVGPGRYALNLSYHRSRPLKIEAQRDSEQNQHFDRPPTLVITGRVVLAGDPARSVPGAHVRGESKTMGSRGFDVVADATGCFSIRRDDGPMLVQARSGDGLLVGVVAIEADAAKVLVPIGLAATVTGRLFDKKSGRGLADRHMDFSIKIPFDGGSSWREAFRAGTQTNSAGEFQMSGLAPGWEYYITHAASQNELGNVTGWYPLHHVEIPKSGIFPLGDLVSHRTEPYPLNTLIFDAMPPEADPAVGWKAAVAEAGLTERRILIVAGLPTSPALRRFFEMYLGTESDREFLRKTVASYRVLAIDTSPTGPASGAVGRFLAERQLRRPSSGADLLFAIFDSQEKEIATADFRQLSLDERLNGPKLFAFLKKHSAPVRDADKLLGKALTSAHREDKRILVHFYKPGSAPSILFSRFLERNRKLLERDYVLLAIRNRDTNANSVHERLSGRKSDLPSLLILDASGRLLIDGKSPQGNVEFPISKAEIGYLQKLFSSTVKRLQKEDVQALIHDVRTKL